MPPAPPMTDAPPSPVAPSARISTPSPKAESRASPKPEENDNENAQSRASPKKVTTTKNAATKAQKLEVRESHRKGQESWTVKAGRRMSFRVRVADSGFRVNLRFYDEQGSEREPYCCYLSAKEWRAAKRQTLADFAAQIVGKIEQRKANESADAYKLDVLIARIQSLT
ncbi:MAG: hypothetical protein M3X11_16375 [Acidobacteriota bacterium]|nr:hypothetical protein [Acidobacteriota bacterium]